MQEYLKEHGKRFLALLCCLLGLLGIVYGALAATPLGNSPAASGVAALLDIKGGVGPATQDFIQRGLRQALKRQAAVVILQIDTPGGLSKSMRGIIKAILASPIPVITYVAPSGARAASAGTYILYASHVAAMAPGTNLGAATPVSIGTPDKAPDKSKGKSSSKKSKSKSARQLKALNDARAYIRSLAQLRGRNVQWAEKAVTRAASLSATEALKLNVINLVAKNIPDLLKKTNGMRVILQGRSHILKTLGLRVEKILPDWRSKFLAVIADPSVAYILLMIGFYGLFFEFANPGFIVPGVAGAIALLIALYAFQLLPINYAGLGLIILGMIFIIAEAFLPNFGVLGIGGVVSFVVGSILLIKTGVAGYGLPISLIVGVAVVTLLFFLIVLQLAFRSRRRPVVSGVSTLLGQQSEIIIDENGKRWIKLQGERWQVMNGGDFQSGDKVAVEAVNGLQLQVKSI